jgi:hypothetical protein
LRHSTIFWKGRPKRRSRRIARDLRVASPAIAIFLCVGMTASVITATESMPRRTSAPIERASDSDAASVSTPDRSASVEADRRREDCSRFLLVHDLDEFDFEDQH